MKLLSEFLAHRAGILITGKVNVSGLYNDYTRFCEQKGVEPEPREAIEQKLEHEIYSIKLWWGAFSPHITDTVIGNFISAEVNALCQPKETKEIAV